jgi:hypothetical protein
MSVRLLAAMIFIGAVADVRAQCVLRSEQDRADWLRCPSLVRAEGSRPADSAGPNRVTTRMLPAQIESGWNSRLPYSLNDGVRWAGRGWSSTATAGARVDYRGLTLSLAPEFIHEQNTPFPILPAKSALSAFANPFHAAGRTIDEPLRFGATPTTTISPGQSLIEARHAHFAAGFATENLWWGPGISNSLLMSNNAAGVPQVYVRTASPLSTPLGRFEGRILLGVLTESRFFDTQSNDDNRALNAFTLALRTRFDSGLTIGVARASYADMQHTSLLSHGADVFLSLPSTGRDELQSIYARWAFADAGLEIHGEWARMRLPSVHELLVDPQRSQGYLVGAQWRGAPRLGELRPVARLEFTTLEQFNTRRGIQEASFYTSFRVAQGYTQRGQVIGAAIGPGSSEQWVSGGLQSERYDVEVAASRIRTDDDAYYLEPAGFTHFNHDVALAGAIRGSATRGRWTIGAELRDEQRMNYLFQSADFFSWDSTFDMHNVSLRFFLQARPD